MAKVTYGALVGSVVGSVGGVTFRGGGAHGVVSARALGKRSKTLAQERQRNLYAEGRRAYDALDELDRRAYDFAVSEAYQLRPEHGARFGNPRAAFTAWWSAIRYTGGSPEVAVSAVLLRRYGAAAEVNATGTALGGVSFKFYTGTAYTGSPYALWMAAARSVAELPARPIWKLIYSAGFDPPIEQTNSGEAAPWNLCTEFGPYVQARASFFRYGSVIAYRYNGPTDLSGVGTSRVQLMQL